MCGGMGPPPLGQERAYVLAATCCCLRSVAAAFACAISSLIAWSGSSV